MSDDYNCRKCYKELLGTIREYLDLQCGEGESLSAEVYGSYGRDCYLAINYATIINKQHITHSEHLPVNFLSHAYIVEILPVILDSLLKQFRKEQQ